MIARVEPLSASLALAGGTSVSQALARAANDLRPTTDAPRLEAELLMAHVLDCSRADLYTHPERPLAHQSLAKYKALLKQRAQGVPLPYLTGRIEFYGLDLAVDPHVLIPRPETETLVDLALTLPAPIIADVGTGSGCIAIALAINLPKSHVYALDLSSDALNTARANAERQGVTGRITFLQSDLLEALPEPVGLIVSNPPYVAGEEWSTLPREVGEHEPRLALYGGPDGLDVVRRLLNQAPVQLRPGGNLLIEIGAAQGAQVASSARRAFPVAGIKLHADLSGHERVLHVQTQIKRKR